MANSGTLFTYQATESIPLDVSPLIDAISYEETPALSTWGKFPVHDKVYHWTDFSRTAPNASNAMVEGASFATASEILRADRSNYTQIFEKHISISRSQDKRAKYGLSDETAWQIKEQLVEIATDLEKALFQGTSSAGSSVAARTMAGLEASITTNALSASSASLTETTFLSILQTIWNAGGRGAKTAYMNAFQKTKFDAFTGNANTRFVVNPQNGNIGLVYNVGMYASSFGVIKAILTPYATTSVVSIVKDGTAEVGVFDPFQKVPLGKTADASNVAVVGEYGFRLRAQAHSGKITTLATA